MGNYLLSVDNGGTYIKAALFDSEGRCVGVARQRNQVISLHPGWTEYDQDALWRINSQCMAKVISQTGINPEEIACVGIAGQGCGCYMLDEAGKSIRNAISSSDERANDQVQRWLRDGTSQRMYERIYRYPSAGHLNAILSWLKENEPENYQKIAHLFAMKDLLVYRLTGNIISSYGCQSASCLMDLRSGTFEREIAEAFGIGEMADKFGPLKWDLEKVGTVTSAAAKLTGLAAGTPVCAGLHDVVASALAMGITDSQLCFMILGTHGINGYLSPVPILNGSILYNEMFAFPGMYLIEEGYPSSAATLEWVLQAIYGDGAEDAGEMYARVNAMVDSLSPCQAVPLFLPFLRGQRDNPKARGAWIGLCPEHTQAHLLRAVYEGVTFSHMLQAEHLFVNRERPPRIRIAGGATGSKVWMQMFADALQIPVEVLPREEMGAKGAAIAAAVAAGIYSDLPCAVRAMACEGTILAPRPEYAKIYQQKYQRFKKAVKTMDALWDEA